MNLTTFLLATLLLTTTTTAKPYIKRFELVNAATNKRVRVLGHHDVISVPFAFNIVAITAGSGDVRHVTFTQPFYKREQRAPYALGGDRKGDFRALSLPDGYYVVSAYVNFDNENFRGFSFRVINPKSGSGALPGTGPLPTQVQPDLGGMEELSVPEQLPSCMQKKLSASIEMENSFYYNDVMNVLVRANWCGGQNKIRLRLLSYETGTNRAGQKLVNTTVLQQKVVKATEHQGDSYIPAFMMGQKCEDVLVFAEVCVRTDGKGLLCATTPFRYVGTEQVPEPRLKYRPPIVLKLAPGDSVTVRTEIGKGNKKNYGFSNGGYDSEKDLALRGTLERKNGDVQFSDWTTRKVVNMRIPVGSAGVSENDNNSLAYMTYANKSCRTNVDSWRSRYSTTILVDKTYTSLIRQDVALPTFETPKYPPTPFNESVEIEVEAQNPGGGKRADGDPTELHYQWYLRTEDYRWVRSYAGPIIGATGRILKLSAAECNAASCGRYGCYNLRIYFVDVCNTFGCRRSGAILPNVLAPGEIPPGQTWDSDYCEFNNVTI